MLAMPADSSSMSVNLLAMLVAVMEPSPLLVIGALADAVWCNPFKSAYNIREQLRLKF